MGANRCYGPETTATLPAHRPNRRGKNHFLPPIGSGSTPARVAGLLSPAVMQDGQKTGIFLEDLNSGEQRLLAIDPLTPHANFVRASSPFGRGESVHTFPVGKWLFDPQVLRWGNAVLASCPPCDLLIVDELGPLEFNVGKGWTIPGGSHGYPAHAAGGGSRPLAVG